MALTKCPDCGHDVSDLAPACPNCGRPMVAPAGPMEKCQVVLLKSVGVGLRFHWALRAQKSTPQGLVTVANWPYSSDNSLANFQASKSEFLRARDKITNELLAAGWELVDTTADSLCLPRFQRPAGHEAAYDPQGGTGAGVVITTVAQRTASSIFEILVDGTKVARMAKAETIRIDLEPGRHTIRADSAAAGWRKSADYIVDVVPDAYLAYTLGYTSSTFSYRIVLRGDGLPLSPGDDGRPLAK